MTSSKKSLFAIACIVWLVLSGSHAFAQSVQFPTEYFSVKVAPNVTYDSWTISSLPEWLSPYVRNYGTKAEVAMLRVLWELLPPGSNVAGLIQFSLQGGTGGSYTYTAKAYNPDPSITPTPTPDGTPVPTPPGLYTINGYVYDSQNYTQLAGVTINSSSGKSNRTVTTGADGSYSAYIEVDAEYFVMTASFAGYESKTYSFAYIGANRDHDFLLRSTSIVPTTEPVSPAPTATPTQPAIVGPGTAWIEPNNITAGMNSEFPLEVRVNTGDRVLMAYGIEISWPQLLFGVTKVNAGQDGFVSSTNYSTDGVYRITGFDASGKGPGTNLHLLTLICEANERSGTTEVSLAVQTLLDPNAQQIGVPAGIGATVTVTAPALGDVNGSGVIDIIDALQVAQYYVGYELPNFIPIVADVNCSGSIDIIDALRIAQYYIGLIGSFC